MFEAQLRRISAFNVGCNSANGDELDNISLVGLRSFLSRACFADVIVLMCNNVQWICLFTMLNCTLGQKIWANSNETKGKKNRTLLPVYFVFPIQVM